jgi:hypothetical protein
MKGDRFLRSYTADVHPVTDDRTVVDFTTPRQARANFGLGEFVSGGLSVAGVGPHGLASELRFRAFDAVHTHRDSAESLLSTPGSPLEPSALREIRSRQQMAETQAGRKLARNVIACALDHMYLGDIEKSHAILSEGFRIVGRQASADLLVMRAALFDRAGQRREALSAIDQALAIEPTNSMALHYRAASRSD